MTLYMFELSPGACFGASAGVDTNNREFEANLENGFELRCR